MYEEISGNLFVLDFTTNCTVCNKACSDACIYGCEGRDYPRAADRLRTAGYHEVARFAGRSTWFESIDEAVK